MSDELKDYCAVLKDAIIEIYDIAWERGISPRTPSEDRKALKKIEELIKKLELK